MPHASTLKHSRSPIPTAVPAEAPTPAQKYAFAMLSDRGLVRRINQDACGARPERGAFVVCDGMGGAAGGEIASGLALDTFLESLANNTPAQPRRIPPKAASDLTRLTGNGALPYAQGIAEEPASPAHPGPPPQLRLEQAILSANHAVYRQAQKLRALRGMGTTLVALLLGDAPTNMEADRGLWVAHVGDSRCYRLRAGELTQLTQDHSLVEEQIQAGLLSRVQASTSPVRNIITRAVGSQPAVEPEIAAHTAQPGDHYLLTSDGLTRELDDAEIAAVLDRAIRGYQPPTERALEDACSALIAAANAHGGNDNITVLLISVL